MKVQIKSEQDIAIELEVEPSAPLSQLLHTLSQHPDFSKIPNPTLWKHRKGAEAERLPTGKSLNDVSWSDGDFLVVKKGSVLTRASRRGMAGKVNAMNVASKSVQKEVPVEETTSKNEGLKIKSSLKRRASLVRITGVAEGLLQLKGTLGSLRVDKNKFEIVKVNLAWGQMTFYDPTAGNLIDVIPLTGFTFDELKKKEKTVTNFTFILNNAKKKDSRTTFCVTSQEELDFWVDSIKLSIDLVSPTISNTTLRDGCLKYNRYVPEIIEKCVTFIDMHPKTEGLFRVPGNKREIDSFLATIDKGENELWDVEDPHLATGLLKAYLRELREPIIPHAFTTDFLNVARNNTVVASQIGELKTLLGQLPVFNRVVLCYLLKFLNRIIKESASNKMDLNNIALVFAPTIIRSDEGKDFNVIDMGPANNVMSLLLEETDNLFSPNDVELMNKEIFIDEVEAVGERLVLTDPESKAIEAALSPYQEPRENPKENVWEYTTSCLMNLNNPKTHTTESRILIADRNRIYLFMKTTPPKLEFEFHIMDITEITSPSKSSLVLSWQSPNSRQQNTINLVPICFASSDTNKIITWILYHWNRNFVGMTPKFSLKIGPPHRLDRINQTVKDCIPNEMEGCAGFVSTYISICNYLKLEASERIIWDLRNYFYPNNIRTFNVSDIIPKDRFPNPEFQTLVLSLTYNAWFTSFISKGINLGNESTGLLANAFKHNKTIEKLKLKDAGITRVGLAPLFQAFLENQNVAIKYLNISGNQMNDQKLVQTFAECLGSTLNKVKNLNISNCQIPKVKPIFEAIVKPQGNYALLNNLTHLKLSNNRFETEANQLIGTVLSSTRSLKTLHMSGCQPNFGGIIKAMYQGDKPLLCVSLETLDVSSNKQKVPDDLIGFLKFFPSVRTLSVAGTGILAECLEEILKNLTHIKTLDISENEFNDAQLTTISKQLVGCMPNLKKLKINKVFTRPTAQRNIAIEEFARAISTIRLPELQMRGGTGNAKLKGDLVDFVCGLFRNNSLQVLDISGHLAGDDLAIALAKLLQHNDHLNTLFWDCNDTTLVGLRAIKLGLQRNATMKHLDLPYVDIFNIRSRNSSEAETDALANLMREISRLASETPEQNLIIPTIELPRKGTFSNRRHTLTVGLTDQDLLRASALFRSGHLPDLTEDESTTSEKNN